MNKSVKTTRHIILELTGDDIIKALVDAGNIDYPEKATCEFQVPGGGDYSNMLVTVDEDAKIVIRYTEDGDRR